MIEFVEKTSSKLLNGKPQKWPFKRVLFFSVAGKSSAAQQHDIAQRKLLAPWVFVGDASSQEHSLENVAKHFKLEVKEN